jgi:hypothetical protein
MEILEYGGIATIERSIEIRIPEGAWESWIDCESTGPWSARIEGERILITGEIDVKATWNSDGWAVCEPTAETFYRWGTTQNDERFTIEWDYETTPTTLSGSYDEDELLGYYETSWTGIVAGWGEITKTEELYLALEIVSPLPVTP